VKTIGVIGSGFSGLAAAATLAKAGYNVTVIEKNTSLGGRARKFEVDGFTFDMGPSWYWMPEVFEDFFATFGKKVEDYYQLLRLDPSYEVVFSGGERIPMPADYEELCTLFESIEKGSSTKLTKFLDEAAYKYKVGMEEFVWKPSHSILEFADFRVFKSLFKLQMLSSIGKQIDMLFKDERLRNILKFPVLFLGATPENTPALYSLMNYADLKLGTWYPQGGMYEVIDGFVKVCKEQGVKFILDAEVTAFNMQGSEIKSMVTKKGDISFDYIIASADYHHVEQHLLPEKYRQYTPEYWDKRTMAPSSLLYYLGLDTKIGGVSHHTLFFDENFDVHAEEIYTDPKWPSKPLFYLSCPSVTDSSIAPVGMTNMFLLMPLAPDIKGDDEATRERYFQIMVDRVKTMLGVDITPHIIYKRSYCATDFKQDYHAFKGNAYGLANTLLQTAFLKPKLKNKKVSNLYYTGQLTTPGPGVPPSIISGQVVANEIIKNERITR